MGATRGFKTRSMGSIESISDIYYIIGSLEGFAAGLEMREAYPELKRIAACLYSCVGSLEEIAKKLKDELCQGIHPPQSDKSNEPT